MNTLASTFRVGALGAALVACIAVCPARAGESADKRGETASVPADVGLVTGFAVGAAAAGPLGAVIGGATGALLGDRYHRQAKTSATLGTDLKKSEAERARLDASLTEAKARDAALTETLDKTEQLGLDVPFRTDDDSVATESVPPLLKLGALVTAMPESRVRVAGFADPRGSEVYNADLSLRRAESVAAVLASAGVPRERIVIEAYGKSRASSTQGNLDAYALERRVTVRLERVASDQLARRD